MEELLVDDSTGEVVVAGTCPRRVISRLERIGEVVSIPPLPPGLKTPQIIDEISKYAPPEATAFFRGVPPHKDRGWHLVAQFYRYL